MKHSPSALFLFTALFSILTIFVGCRKDQITTDPSVKLTFSADSVIFDTVFTSIGSVTRKLMVYNTHNDRLNISSISLAAGEQSPFRINVDGSPGTNVKDIEIAPHDSAFIFVRVTIDPTDESNPYVVEDDLNFRINGNEQMVKLVAWGQNAIYILADQQVDGFPAFHIVADSLETVTWTAEKPYVVYGYALINSYGKLIMEPGTRVYFHDKSGLWAYVNGVLQVKGSLENPVTFQGDRLDQDYRDVPGQWDRIWLMEGRAGFDHEIDYAIIRNGFIGLQAESFLTPTANRLKISNTIIENHTGIGVFSRLFNIEADNVVIANCGNYAAALTMGGSYQFWHMTMANNWSFGPRNNPSLFLSNYFLDNDENTVPVPLNFSAGNSIIYGSNNEEVLTDFVAGADSVYLFDNCLIRTERNLSLWPGFKDCLVNIDPQFRDYETFDFQLDTLSPAIDKGKAGIAAEVPYDLNGVDRTLTPDLGAYEFVKPFQRLR
ncbi:MAG: hypothetical protein KKD74_11765 [Bacteroidetes bacterium]|nr:hypothetical protein [Bacteroidota bacterium]